MLFLIVALEVSPFTFSKLLLPSFWRNTASEAEMMENITIKKPSYLINVFIWEIHYNFFSQYNKTQVISEKDIVALN